MLIEISLLGPSARGEPPVTPYEGGKPTHECDPKPWQTPSKRGGKSHIIPLRGGKGGQRIVRGGPTILSGWAVGLSVLAIRVPERLPGGEGASSALCNLSPPGPDDFGTHPLRRMRPSFVRRG